MQNSSEFKIAKKIETIIYVVIEQGIGMIHKAFEMQVDAIEFADSLNKQEGIDCYEVKPLDYSFYYTQPQEYEF